MQSVIFCIRFCCSVYIDLTVVSLFCFPALIRLAYLRVKSNIVSALYKKRIMLLLKAISLFDHCTTICARR